MKALGRLSVTRRWIGFCFCLYSSERILHGLSRAGNAVHMIFIWESERSFTKARRQERPTQAARVRFLESLSGASLDSLRVMCVKEISLAICSAFAANGGQLAANVAPHK
jgi:hypothetical protein